MLELAPIIKAFIKRQLEKKIPTILEGTDFYPQYLTSNDNKEAYFNKILFINLYCSEESIHYVRLVEREKQRSQNPSRVDLYFKNIRKKNNLLHDEIIQLKDCRMKSLDVSYLSKKQVLIAVEEIIERHCKINTN